MNTTIKSTPATNKNGDGLRYIYNIFQANYYIEQHGIAPVKVGKHKNTGVVFFAFTISEKVDKAFSDWCTREHLTNSINV